MMQRTAGMDRIGISPLSRRAVPTAVKPAVPPSVFVIMYFGLDVDWDG